MRILWGIFFVSLVASVGLMTPLAAGVFCNGLCTGPCSTCRPAALPCNTCHSNPCGCAALPAPAVPVVPQTQTILQQRTIMQPQQVSVPQTTYRDVVRTEYRTQPEAQMVPVTRYRQVTVDEGHWQQVWVSKPVAKQVPETVMEQRTAYRTVPYQVTQRVPETVMTTHTQWVPRVVSEPVQVRSACSPCGSVPAVSGAYLPPLASSPVYAPLANTYAAPSYGTAYYGAPAYAPNYGPMIGAIPSNGIAANLPPAIGRGEMQPLNAVSSLPSEDLRPVPEAHHLDTPRTSHNDWQSVSSRAASREPVRTSSSNSSLFVPPQSRRIR